MDRSSHGSSAVSRPATLRTRGVNYWLPAHWLHFDEYQLCLAAGMGGGDVEKAITELYSKRGETRRVKLADGLSGAAYDAAGLGLEFETAINDILLCVQIRNQYAHCIWHDDSRGRLVFAHMEEIAVPGGPRADPINLTFHYVDVPLLEEQANFFST